jgi:hypothetical protein
LTLRALQSNRLPIAANTETNMSKQEMARMLIERGSKLAFNTLRKYSREDLEAMLQATPADTQPATPADTQSQQPVDATPCTVPTDRELYAAALQPASKPETPFVPPTWGASLAFVGLAFLEMLGLK